MVKKSLLSYIQWVQIVTLQENRHWECDTSVKINYGKIAVQNAIAKNQADSSYLVRIKIDIPEKQPLEMILSSNPSFHNLWHVPAIKFEQLYFSGGTGVCCRIISQWLVYEFHQNSANPFENFRIN